MGTKMSNAEDCGCVRMFDRDRPCFHGWEIL